MKIKEGFVLRHLLENWIVVAVGPLSLEFTGVLNLNETGAALWQLIEAGKERSDLVAFLTDNYEVSVQQAQKDVDALLQKLLEFGCIEQ